MSAIVRAMVIAVVACFALPAHEAAVMVYRLRLGFPGSNGVFVSSSLSFLTESSWLIHMLSLGTGQLDPDYGEPAGPQDYNTASINLV
jgi:hypothetical protein